MPDVGAPKNDIGYDQISGETSNYDPSAKVGNFLYRMYGDPAVVFNDAGTGYVRYYGKDYYTSLVTKGDWLYRKYGNSIIVRDADGIAYARFGGGDWYVASLPRIDVSTQQPATTKEAEIAREKTDMLAVDLNNSLAGAVPNLSPVVNATEGKSDIIDYSNLFQAHKQIQTDFYVSPTNTAFVNAKLSDEDIANGYRLKYNSNGVLWRVNAAGIPHPDDLRKFYKQQEILQGLYDNVQTKLQMVVGISPENGGSEAAGNAVKGVSKAETDASLAVRESESIVAKEPSKVDYSLIYRANGLSPKSGGYTNVAYVVDTFSLVSRPYYEGAIIHTQDGFFKVTNGIDTYINPPPKDTLYWDQNNNNSGLGLYKVAGYENAQFWSFLGGAGIALRVGKAATEVAALAQETSVSERVVGIFGPLNKGPLPEAVANSFRSATYSQKVLEEDIILYRVYGGKANELGSYWTRTKPGGPLQSIIDSALDQKWGNTATEVVQIRVPKGTTIFEGFAASQGGLVGGGNQVFIYLERVDPSWLIR
ncbi:Hypothetical protein LUCI_4968 [Lucifera butyrica]|uniref:Uncharacterized protein n=1 Tax=Lucifera butyrica TaxID=1351585 RepID=A0A498RFT3_9FIRM|nr:hypothetical protein [Lucifera butyrica]VBB09670.1 Hypothetical protein LUCI_4968 [Lucifera butyrica]